jgi:ornithine lipid hydroxylase
MSSLCQSPLCLKALQRLSFPVLFGGAAIAAALLYSPESAVWAMPLIVLGVGVLTVLLERLLPFEPDWRADRRTGLTDLSYLALTSLFARAGEVLAWTLALFLVGTMPSMPLWPTEWPVVAQVFLAFAIGDFLPYLYHRASHESGGFLWRIHAIHHAPERMYALNFARFHPINALVTASLTLLPLAVLGAEPSVIFIAGVLHNVHGILSHANVDFRLGPLNAVFSMAELHRWHHARDPRLANGNYGATVLIWDWLFGTRRDPGRRVAADGIGLWSGSAVPERMSAQTWYPFASPARQARIAIAKLATRVGWRCCSST